MMTDFILSNSDFCPHCCSYGTCDCSPLEIELRELLPDDLYDSKDWRRASSIGRIEWLITMLANKNEEINMWVDMINKLNEEVDYHTSQGGHV